MTKSIPFQVTPDLAASVTSALVQSMTERLVGATPMLSWQAQGCENGSAIARNGSASLIRTPECIIGVTAAHVSDAYMGHKRACRRIEATLGGLRFDLEERIIAVSSSLDIATFAVDECELPLIGFNVLEGAWPPIAPREGDFIVFAGWPGSERHITPDIVTGGAWTGLARAQVSGDIITIDIDHTQGLLSPVPGVPPPPPNYEVGGISGGPVMTILPRERGFDWRLGGVIIHGTAAWDIVRAVQADAIGADGSICTEGTTPGNGIIDE